LNIAASCPVDDLRLGLETNKTQRANRAGPSDEARNPDVSSIPREAAIGG
jgi:hypothetical protein